MNLSQVIFALFITSDFLFPNVHSGTSFRTWSGWRNSWEKLKMIIHSLIAQVLPNLAKFYMLLCLLTLM